MLSNELCKRLNEMSHKNGTIPESQRYSAHFEYHDLVKRLNKVKQERELLKPVGNSSIDLKSVLKRSGSNKPNVNSKKSLYYIYTERLNRNNSEKGLPALKSPKTKLTPKCITTGRSQVNLRILKVNKSIKLNPLLKKNPLT